MVQTFKTIFLAKQQLTADVFTFAFVCPKRPKLSFKPGQYMLLEVPQADGSFKVKQYSICSPDQQKKAFTLLVKVLPRGIGSDYLKQINPGEQIEFKGPAGVFIMKENARPKFFMATGTGIAPVLSILQSELVKYPKVEFYLYWGIKTLPDVYFFDLFKELTRRYPYFTFTICLSREPNLDSLPEEHKPYFGLGRVQQVLNQHKRNLKTHLPDADWYLAGDANIVESLRQHFLAQNLSPEHLTFEKFV